MGTSVKISHEKKARTLSVIPRMDNDVTKIRVLEVVLACPITQMRAAACHILGVNRLQPAFFVQ